ncbi:hypothetical protein BX600DRAFT_287955 [Xylariales sp. PMI_506]|nr:hypothetical protein BX600DRAFT_287955 [Xylariales sp. PMI_506]
MGPMYDEMPQHRTRGPRLYHKKSRNGCVRCKQRRVKCDEVHPSCSGCSRHMVDCVYQATTPVQATPPSSSTRAKSKAAALAMNSAELDIHEQITTPFTSIKLSPSSSGASVAPTPQGFPAPIYYQPSPNLSPTPDYADEAEPVVDFPESRERRLWELRLLHNSLAVARPFAQPQPPHLQQLWSIDVPNMALNEGKDVILYGMLAHSALNLWARSSDPKEREELVRLQQTYLSLMLREQRREVANLNPSNAECLCFSSLKILTHALALIQTLPSDPWEPPLDLFHMGKGAGAVFLSARPMVQGEAGSKIFAFLRSPPMLDDRNDTLYGDHSELDWILDLPPSLDPETDYERDDKEVMEVYNQANAYTCSIRRALDRQEPEFAICRRLGAFAVFVPNEFTQFLQERRPRAMVVFAHFMALFLEIEHVWLIGKAGESQIRGIQKNLPIEWSYKLDKLFSKFRAPEDSPLPTPQGYGCLI